MAKVKGFKALRYNHNKISDISEVIAPPYDVINKHQQELLYSMHENNIIKVDLNKTEGDIKYDEAGEIFSSWIENQVLVEEDKESIYPYHQKFTFKNKEYERLGIVALVKLSDFDEKIVLPHEETFSGPKADRLKLMNSCKTNISPIFGVYDNSEDTVEKLVGQFIKKNDPIIEAKSLDGITNKIWKISDNKTISKISSFFDSKEILIADGHHRYETSLNYSKANRSDKTSYVMFYLTGAIQDGLLINPTHRILNDVSSSKEITKLVIENFKTVSWSGDMNEDSLQPNEFFYIDKKNNSTLKCTINDNELERFYSMSVYAVQEKIIDSFKETYSSVGHFKSLEDAKSSINSESIGLILPKFVPSDIMKVVLNNDKMPQKSTYFYPKVATGLLFNKLY
ncbi:DUF1015 domain-containing protein [bacterium]|jgi:uncharacterized protein (DUF1015 family)|nr:DUF1015 domain-containing protein [bacterium]MBT3795114.1 DUF1015 domain-containing protein [bacterium]MBT4634201.1 DUF1015 domain-containing protein [bacterium]